MADTLRNHFGTVNDGSEEALTVASSGQITILSILICNKSATDTLIDIYWDDNSDSNNKKYLYKSMSFPGESTFEHTDKVVLDANDILYYDTTVSTQVEAVCSYLLQT